MFNISAKPILVDEKPYVLEVVQPFSYTQEQLQSDTPKLLRFVSDLNQRILLDQDTNASLIRILDFSDIREKYGQISVTGVACFLYDLLCTTFQTGETAPLLVRKSEDSFFVAEKDLSYDVFVSRIQKLVREIPTQYLVFQNEILPFEIKAGCVDLSSETFTSAKELFAALEKQL